MASSEGDHDDGNETREEESSFVALFKKRVKVVRRGTLKVHFPLISLSNQNLTICLRPFKCGTIRAENGKNCKD